jgi:Tfp pilus assembly protein PilF
MVDLLLATLLATQSPVPPVTPPEAQQSVATTRHAPAAGTPDAGFPAAPPSPTEIMAVPAELRDLVRTRVQSRIGPRKGRMDRLLALLFEPDGLGMEYAADATHTVAGAYRTRKANCLTFTLLTVALAREAGATAYGQEIERTLSWSTGGDNVFVQNMHVNAGLEADSRRFTIDVATNQLLFRSPPRRITDARLVALYYNNVATDLMLQGRDADAEPWLQAALSADPTHASPWSNMGVLAQRLGRPRDAEHAFLQALARNRTHTSALANIVSHYQRHGNPAQARRWRLQAEAAQRSDPLQQFLLARDAEQRGDLQEATIRYQRAVRLDRTQHLFHAALARVWLQRGEPRRAADALMAASKLESGGDRQRYQATLEKLRRGAR